MTYQCPECGLVNAHEVSCSKFNDQIQANFMATIPSLWKNIHDNLIKEGFAPEVALRILLAYVHGASGGKLQ